MTPLAGFILALIAGWLVPNPRRAAAVVVIPFLAVLTAQTWGIAAGRGVSPPDTVTPLSGAISYYVFQAVFLALALGIAAELATLRARSAAHRDPASWRPVLMALAIGSGLTAAFLAAYLVTSAPVLHHSSEGAPPPQGIIGIGLLFVTVIVLGILVRRGRRAVARPGTAAGQQDPVDGPGVMHVS
jgi:hypothetical protein